MAFVVGNKTFSSLRDAQAYLDSLQEFGGGGSITPFDTSLLAGSGDRTSTRMFTNDQEMSPEEFASGVTAPAFITESSGGDVFKEPAEIDPSEQIGPTEELGIEDSIFQILMETIIGEQGIPEGVSAEAIAAIRGDFGPTTTPEELQEIAIDIAEAGGFDEWLAQQDLEGPPEELPTELEEEEVDIDADTTLEDEIGVEPDMPIDIPFPDLPPREEGEEGEGENGEGTGAEGEGEGTGRGQDRGDGEETPRGGGFGGGSVDYDPVGQSEQDPFRVVFGPIAAGSSGEGVGEGGGVASTGMLTPRFNPYMASIGYTPVAVPKPILPQAPIVSSLFSEFLS